MEGYLIIEIPADGAAGFSGRDYKAGLRLIFKVRTKNRGATPDHNQIPTSLINC